MADGRSGMSDYWKAFWDGHVASSAGADPQSRVLRTLNGRPVTDERFEGILKHIGLKMDLSGGNDVLDLCCGNGLITTHLASKCRSVVGVDFAPGMVGGLDLEGHGNIEVMVEDVRKVSFQKRSFDRVLMYSGLQYMTCQEAAQVFESVSGWLRGGGLFFVGDIPDRDRIWEFFDSDERRRIYFDSLKNGRPAIGTWFDGGWLARLGKYAGFSDVEVLRQPEYLPYAHYRFDVVLRA
jgi:cyclopropane fatty-acyl-phospholipid synthase-like methyltransferase